MVSRHIFNGLLALFWGFACPLAGQQAAERKPVSLPAADSLLAAGLAAAAGDAYFAWAESLQKSGNKPDAAAAFQVAGKILTEEANQYQKAKTAYTQALALFTELGDPASQAYTHYRLAGCLHQNYDYPQALGHYLEAKHLFETLKNKEGEGMVLSDLGWFYRDCDNMMSALQAGFQALEIHEQLRDTSSIIYDLQNLAIFHDETERYEKALELYLRALNLSKAPEPMMLNNIANTYKNKKEYDLAIRYAQESLKIAREANDDYPLPFVYSTLCEIYTRLNRLPEALEYGQKCLDIAEANADLETLKIAQMNLSDIYERKGDMAAALRYFKGYITARDSITNEEKNREITRRSLQFDFDKREAVAAAELSRQKTVRNAFIGGFVLMLALAGLIFRSFRREQHTKTIIALEKQKSDDLLLNILPATAAEELKTKGHSDARLFDHATVLFSDFKDFTRVSERVSPAELVKMIDLYFSEFDRIVTRHGIEKIKTVGDAYVCANGLNQAGTDRPQAVVQAAIEIQAFVSKFKADADRAGQPFSECRIGLHTGPVVAGVVGLKKFTYDIWGDTVNVAARMEQNGAPGRINVSEDTHGLVRDDFFCQYRGKIEAKNKGEINMYFVEAKTATPQT